MQFTEKGKVKILATLSAYARHAPPPSTAQSARTPPLVLLPHGETLTYQHCAIAVQQATSQSEPLSEITSAARSSPGASGSGVRGDGVVDGEVAAGLTHPVDERPHLPVAEQAGRAIRRRRREAADQQDLAVRAIAASAAAVNRAADAREGAASAWAWRPLPSVG